MVQNQCRQEFSFLVKEKSISVARMNYIDNTFHIKYMLTFALDSNIENTLSTPMLNPTQGTYIRYTNVMICSHERIRNKGKLKK